MKVDVLVPTSLSEITLEQFVRLYTIEENTRGSLFHMQKCVEIMCNIDLKSVATIKYTDVKSIYETVSNLFDQEPVFKPRFVMDGVEYGFIPELDEMSLGEYIDIDENITDWEKMHKAMCVMFRPVTHSKEERYDIEKYSGQSNAYKFHKMPIDVALGANFFLFNLGIELLKATLNFSEEEMDGMTSLEKHNLLVNGAGFKASLDSLQEMLQKSNILLS